MKIEEVNIGDLVLDGKVVERIVNKTTNSIEVTRTKRGPDGINCAQWFTWKDFTDNFKKVKYETSIH